MEATSTRVCLGGNETREEPPLEPELGHYSWKLRKVLPRAVATSWTGNSAWRGSISVVVQCPSEACGKTHNHCTKFPHRWYESFRISYCNPAHLSHLSYRIVYPFEDLAIVHDLSYRLDRGRMTWRTVGLDSDDGDEIDDDNEDFQQRETSQETEELTGLEIELAGLSVEDRAWSERKSLFDGHCICGELDQVRHDLEVSINPQKLINGPDEAGKHILAKVCQDGHPATVEFLVEKGADLECKGGGCEVPLIEALRHERGSIAKYLIDEGASTEAKESDSNMPVLEIAKSILQHMTDDEKHCPFDFDDPERSIAQREEREANRAYFREIIEQCEARRNKIRMAWKMRRDAARGRRQVYLRKVLGDNPTASVLINTFMAPLATEHKTLAFLDRGECFKPVSAVSDYTPGPHGGTDGCLDRVIWVDRVFKLAKIVNHPLKACEQDNKKYPPGSYFASHAEKQVIAYFVWHYTTIFFHAEVGDEEEETSDAEEIDWDKVWQLRQSGPAGAPGVEKNIHVTQESCSDCAEFQRRVEERCGFQFNVMIGPFLGDVALTKT